MMKTVVSVAMFALLFTVGCTKEEATKAETHKGHEHDAETHSMKAEAPAMTMKTAKKEIVDVNNAICPVMGGETGEADEKYSAVYKGKRYLFCCSACAPKFNKEPEKYIKKIK